jgi:hypothetical protein
VIRFNVPKMEKREEGRRSAAFTLHNVAFGPLSSQSHTLALKNK